MQCTPHDLKEKLLKGLDEENNKIQPRSQEKRIKRQWDLLVKRARNWFKDAKQPPSFVMLYLDGNQIVHEEPPHMKAFSCHPEVQTIFKNVALNRYVDFSGTHALAEQEQQKPKMAMPYDDPRKYTWDMLVFLLPAILKNQGIKGKCTYRQENCPLWWPDEVPFCSPNSSSADGQRLKVDEMRAVIGAFLHNCKSDYYICGFEDKLDSFEENQSDPASIYETQPSRQHNGHATQTSGQDNGHCTPTIRQEHDIQTNIQDNGQGTQTNRLDTQTNRPDRQTNSQDNGQDTQTNRQDTQTNRPYRQTNSKDNRQDTQTNRQDTHTNIQDNGQETQTNRQDIQTNRLDRQTNSQDGRPDPQTNIQDNRQDTQTSRQDTQTNIQDKRQDTQTNIQDNRQDRQTNRQDTQTNRQDTQTNSQDNRQDTQTNKQDTQTHIQDIGQDTQTNIQDNEQEASIDDNRLHGLDTATNGHEPQKNRQDRHENKVINYILNLWCNKAIRKKNLLLTICEGIKLTSDAFVFLDDKVSDEVVDAYMFTMLRQNQSEYEYISCAQMALIFNKRYQDRVEDYNIPSENAVGLYNIGRKHWILVIIYCARRILLIIDPLGELYSTQNLILNNWRSFLQGSVNRSLLHGSIWKVETVDHCKQQDSNSCGIFCLQFAERYICKKPLHFGTSQFDIRKMRVNVVSTILGNQDDQAVLSVCRICRKEDHNRKRPYKSDGIQWVGCDACGMFWCHFDCMKIKHTDYSTFATNKWLCDICTQE